MGLVSFLNSDDKGVSVGLEAEAAPSKACSRSGRQRSLSPPFTASTSVQAIAFFLNEHSFGFVDRLLHHAETITIEGQSYRMKDQIES